MIQVPLLILAGLGLGRMLRRQATRLLAVLILIYAGYFYLIVSLNMPMLRYFAPVLPLLLLAASAGLSTTFLLAPNGNGGHPQLKTTTMTREK